GISFKARRRADSVTAITWERAAHHCWTSGEGALLHPRGALPMTTLTSPTTPRIALKNILVATDFSALSHRAMDYAMSFARRYDATLIAAHVISPMFYPAPSTAFAYDALDPLPYFEGVRREVK